MTKKEIKERIPNDEEIREEANKYVENLKENMNESLEYVAEKGEIDDELSLAYQRGMEAMRDMLYYEKCEQFEVGDKVVNKTGTMCGVVKAVHPEMWDATIVIEKTYGTVPPPNNANITVSVDALEKINEEQ